MISECINIIIALAMTLLTLGTIMGGLHIFLKQSSINRKERTHITQEDNKEKKDKIRCELNDIMGYDFIEIKDCTERSIIEEKQKKEPERDYPPVPPSAPSIIDSIGNGSTSCIVTVTSQENDDEDINPAYNEELIDPDPNKYGDADIQGKDLKEFMENDDLGLPSRNVTTDQDDSMLPTIEFNELDMEGIVEKSTETDENKTHELNFTDDDDIGDIQEKAWNDNDGTKPKDIDDEAEIVKQCNVNYLPDSDEMTKEEMMEEKEFVNEHMNFIDRAYGKDFKVPDELLEKLNRLAFYSSQES